MRKMFMIIPALFLCLYLVGNIISAQSFSSRLYSFPTVKNLNSEIDNLYNKIRDLQISSAKRGGVVSTYDVSLNTTTAKATVNTVTLVIDGVTYTVLTK